jgi:hypothetical protein
VRFLWIATLGLAACFDAPEFQCVEDAECVRDGDQGRCELAGYCSFEDASCEGGRRFPEASAELSNVCLTVASPCLLPLTALEAWRLEIPVVAGYGSQDDVEYAVDNRESLAGTSYSRVAYCLLLDDDFVYTELDDFTAGDVADTGVPTDKIFDVPVGNLTVRSSTTAVTAVEAGSGSIELWPNCYGPGDSGDYDTDDEITGTTPTRCYGSFQVHHETSVVWAFNQWTSNAVDLGIGINPALDTDPDANADWTFEDNAGDYDVRTLQAFIVP